jgi:hypothetical protein
MELGSVTLKRIGFFCFPIKHSTHTHRRTQTVSGPPQSPTRYLEVSGSQTDLLTPWVTLVEPPAVCPAISVSREWPYRKPFPWPRKET